MTWPPQLLSVGHLLSVGDLTCVALAELLDLAERLEADAAGFDSELAGQTVACFFDPPTTGATTPG